MVLLEELGKLKKFNDLIGNQTRDLPACSIVPQLFWRAPFIQNLPQLASIYPIKCFFQANKPNTRFHINLSSFNNLR
jgi:hypothetical protein